MFSAIRPAARRLLYVQPNASFFVAKSRSIASQSIAFNRPATASAVSPLYQRIQRRWNSDETTKNVAENQGEGAKLSPMADSQAEAEAFIQEAALNASNDRISTETPATAVEHEIEADRFGNDAALDESSSTLVRYQENRPKVLESNLTPKETVYIGNLFFDVTAEDLKARMESFGVVEKSIIIHDSRGLSKGFGYVTFDSIDSAQRAVNEMNQQVYEGRRVIVQFSQGTPSESRTRNPRIRKPTRSLYIGNLSYNLTDRELNDLFKTVRNVVEVRIAVDRQTGQPRGFAHADFLDIASAQAAFELLSSKAPHGRRLRLDFSEGIKKPGSGNHRSNNVERREDEN